METEDALEHLVSMLQRHLTAHQHSIRRPEKCLEVYLAAQEYWRNRGRRDLEPSDYLPFYDAAWRLCQMGVIRPGRRAPMGQALGAGFTGDEFALTVHGENWLQSPISIGFIDPSRAGTILQSYVSLFGEAYGDRASEAARCYVSRNYLATCAMSGAAAESILLSVAIAKIGDERSVLDAYRKSSGRREVINLVSGKLKSGVADNFRLSAELISFWRDESSHGAKTSISEPEAYTCLGRLIRLAQHSSDNWGALTSRE